MLYIKVPSYLIFLYLIFLSTSFVYADTNIQQSIEDEELKRQRQIEEEKILRTSPSDSDIRQQASPVDDIKITLENIGNKCIKIWQINIDSESINLNYINVYQKYLFQCIKQDQIKQIVSDIQLLYLDKGYTTARAYLGRHTDIIAGKIHIKVKVGKVESVIINGNKENTDTLQSNTAFFLLAGEELNIKDLEQGMDQLRRLESHTAKMQIKPSKREGYSIVDVKVSRKDLNKLSLTFDDYGSESSGKERYKVNYTRDNFFRIGDTFTISYQDVYNAEAKQYSKSQVYTYNIPLGYWSFNYNRLLSEYSIPIEGLVSDFISSGDTIKTTYTLTRVLARIKSDRIKLSLSHTDSESRNYINGTIIDISSSAHNYNSLKLEYIKYFAKGYNIFNISRVDGEYSYGPPIIYEGGEVGKFSTAEYYNKLTYKFINWLTYALTFNGKQALTYVGSSQRFAISSTANVRGYSQGKSYFHGYALKNNVNLKVLGNTLNIDLYYDIGRGYNQDESLEDEIRGYGSSISYKPFKYINIKYEKNIPVDKDELEKQGYVLEDYLENYAVDLVYRF